ncbi:MULTISPECIES: hypothetical protein [Butyricimonas]|uniref:hypothetical protein n=1 Tax=Butyricimonas TaxID=574697 RepID=UPI001D08460F|nr:MULTISPECIES: hypothetical protein [Butyricimonas]MCB6974719.1 hypothetical protein [Butyricimonas synergistica]MCG4521427.1 hypothetical protein [Butyricimonas sp. DFI.6.44]
MKKKILLPAIALFFIHVWACQDIDVGYLVTEYAGYGLDSLVIPAKLDDAPPTLIPNPDLEASVSEYEMMLQMLKDMMGLEPPFPVGSGMEYMNSKEAFRQYYIDMGIPEFKEEEAGADYTRVKYNIPWASTPIEGIEGSAPIYCKIKSITSEDGDVSKLQECIRVRGDGTFEVPVINDVPVGRYVLSLNFTNEGWSKDVNNCFTIIVK